MKNVAFGLILIIIILISIVFFNSAFKGYIDLTIDNLTNVSFNQDLCSSCK